VYKKYDYIVASGGLKVPLPDLSLYTLKYYEANQIPRVYHDPDYEEHLYETGLQGGNPHAIYYETDVLIPQFKSLSDPGARAGKLWDTVNNNEKQNKNIF